MVGRRRPPQSRRGVPHIMLLPLRLLVVASLVSCWNVSSPPDLARHLAMTSSCFCWSGPDLYLAPDCRCYRDWYTKHSDVDRLLVVASLVSCWNVSVSSPPDLAQHLAMTCSCFCWSGPDLYLAPDCHCYRDWYTKHSDVDRLLVVASLVSCWNVSSPPDLAQHLAMTCSCFCWSGPDLYLAPECHCYRDWYTKHSDVDRLLVVASLVSCWNVSSPPDLAQHLAMTSSCFCWSGPDLDLAPECRCYGDLFTEIPTNLSQPLRKLTITDAGIVAIQAHTLQPYRTLREFTVMNVKHFQYFEPGLFTNMTRLRTIYIYNAPSLVHIAPSVFDVSLPRLKILRIINTGLKTVPDLSLLLTLTPLVMIDLENNQISKLHTNGIRVRAESLVINYNIIQEVDRGAFNLSQIAKVSLKGNNALVFLHEYAFEGLKSLRHLDLSETAITSLPTEGLRDLEVLRVQETRSLKVFPSVYKFELIREVYLTYAYHCCAFRFPAKHDIVEYHKHQEFIRKTEELCHKPEESESPHSRVERSWDNEPWLTENDTAEIWGELQTAPTPLGATSAPLGTFHQKVPVKPNHRIHALCGNLSKNYQEVLCYPAPDAFNPCEDIMGHWTLRAAVWVVAVLALFGNIAVILVLLSSRFRITVPKFLMCNLALADFCMGVYLLLIAVMDARSIGDYFNYAIDWQNGDGCRVAGFLTVFACELSIFTLAVITVERWYTITYAIHLNRRLKLSTAAKIMAGGWLYSTVMAVLPLVGVSSYSKTSICLPLENLKALDLSYLIILLLFNGLAFAVICACYGRMYCSIRGGQDAAASVTRSDMTVAKRMALLVFTDFACWAPIAFFGITALAGYPLIDVSKTKILLVFFYPLNSCANPYLYALLTQQYRRDLFVLLSRHGLCARTAARYKGTGVIERGGIPQNTQRRGVTPESTNHRGSLLTTVTSLDCPTRPGSLDMVPECPLAILSREHSENTLNKSSSYL
ncbi:lutropin-choriogonadotropic hormone receptor-like [Macrosteles quadrilineatus]|uniref:lutropin-choriogonadotropic hormone receptor-like n=1 Tax=Macrosteles quadrilineatus TaxID=74068 RepID=UPI0023E2388C|nr:lutropin-choriogonadotropic hormone receptor-like [Macrosteles quadrilineatus]